MAYDPMAHGKLSDLYDQRDLLIFLSGKEWFNNQAIELLKKTFWLTFLKDDPDYPDIDWKHHLSLWEFSYEMSEYSIKT